MATFHQDLDPGQPADEITGSIYIALAAILLILCGVGLYAYPRDSQMIVTATNAIDQVDAAAAAPAK